MSGKTVRRARPTSRDVAALAGVAQSTVSAAMSGNRTVAAETKRRIDAAMAELGYQPNAGARTLRTAKTNVVALVIELSDAVDGVETVPYIDAVIDSARRRDHDVVLSMASEGPAGLHRLIARSICDGLIVMDVQRHDERIPVIVDLGQPTVLVGEPADAAGLDTVDFNSRLAASMMVDDLAATGHDQLLLLAAEDPDQLQSFTAFSGFFDAALERARQHGMLAEVLTPDSLSWRDVNNLAPIIADRASSRLGLMARTSRGTEWLLRLLLQTDLEVGVDVSLSALCTDEIARSFGVGITNVSPRPRATVKRAVELLFKRMAGSTEPGVVDLISPERLTRRESTVRFDLR